MYTFKLIRSNVRRAVESTYPTDAKVTRRNNVRRPVSRRIEEKDSRNSGVHGVSVMGLKARDQRLTGRKRKQSGAAPTGNACGLLEKGGNAKKKRERTSRFLASVSLFRDGPDVHVAACSVYPRVVFSPSGLSASR